MYFFKIVKCVGGVWGLGGLWVIGWAMGGGGGIGILLLFKKDLEESRYRQYLNPSQNTTSTDLLKHH